MNLDFSQTPAIDELKVEEYLAPFKAHVIKEDGKLQSLKLALSMIDLTTLKGTDTEGSVKQLCEKALRMSDELPDLPTAAAVCVYPNFVGAASKALEGTSVKIASVAGGFPSGQTSLEIKIAETKYALDQGADEIDMVISRGKFLDKEYNLVHDEIASLKDTCGERHLKVILETGELLTLDNVRIASELAIAAGADFIKTSTGKIQPAATLEATYVMLKTIGAHYERTGKMIGMKPAGGISDAGTALQYLALLDQTLGEQWMNKEYFRFGASSLAGDLVRELSKA